MMILNKIAMSEKLKEAELKIEKLESALAGLIGADEKWRKKHKYEIEEVT